MGCMNEDINAEHRGRGEAEHQHVWGSWRWAVGMGHMHAWLWWSIYPTATGSFPMRPGDLQAAL